MTTTTPVCASCRRPGFPEVSTGRCPQCGGPFYHAPAPVVTVPSRAPSTAEMVLIGLLGLAGAALFGMAGLWMLSLRSVNGGTVAEAFDQAMGLFSLGMAALSLLVAVSAATRR